MIEQVKISITLQDDSIVIMSFVTNDYNGINRQATNENIQVEFLKMNLDVKSWRVIQESDIIQDRTFRNAWKDSGSELHVHMPTAREIHKDRLRLERTKLLNDLDVEYMRADELNDDTKKQEISNKKQILRDITKHPNIESAQTPEELKNFWF